jgi:hypothetical protein
LNVFYPNLAGKRYKLKYREGETEELESRVSEILDRPHGLGCKGGVGFMRRGAVLTTISNRLYSKNAGHLLHTASGRSPVLDYIQDLSKPERARLLEALDQIERHGFAAVRVQFRQIEGKLWELGYQLIGFSMCWSSEKKWFCFMRIRNKDKNCLSRSGKLP